MFLDTRPYFSANSSVPARGVVPVWLFGGGRSSRRTFQAPVAGEGKNPSTSKNKQAPVVLCVCFFS